VGAKWTDGLPQQPPVLPLAASARGRSQAGADCMHPARPEPLPVPPPGPHKRKWGRAVSSAADRPQLRSCCCPGGARRRGAGSAEAVGGAEREALLAPLWQRRAAQAGGGGIQTAVESVPAQNLCPSGCLANSVFEFRAPSAARQSHVASGEPYLTGFSGSRLLFLAQVVRGGQDRAPFSARSVRGGRDLSGDRLQWLLARGRRAEGTRSGEEGKPLKTPVGFAGYCMLPGARRRSIATAVGEAGMQEWPQHTMHLV